MDVAALIEECLMDNVVLVSWAQQRDSVTHIHLPTPLQILSSQRLVEHIEWSSFR